jgi:GLPGLI family protein
MKSKLLAGACLILAVSATAQVKEGKVTYERTTKIQISIAGMNDEMASQLPKTRTDKFELNFANNQSLWKAAEEQNSDADEVHGGGGMQIRMVVAGNDDVLYCNFDNSTKCEKRELFDKQFIVDDSLRPLKWKLTGETKTILGHPCQGATASSITKRMMMNMDNGKMERKETSDTSVIAAWFASDVPVSAGPAEYQGQLPGLILELTVAGDRQIYKAVGFTPKAEVASIKAPTGKKHYTPAEFKAERDKLMDEMQKNNSGPGRSIQIRN